MLGGGLPPQRGVKEGSSLAGLGEMGRLSAALQKLPVGAPATRAGHGYGPCLLSCPPAPLSTCRPA